MIIALICLGLIVIEMTAALGLCLWHSAHDVKEGIVSDVFVLIYGDDTDMNVVFGQFTEGLTGYRLARLPEFIEDKTISSEVVKYLRGVHPYKSSETFVYERLLEDGRYLLARVN